jgi:formylglycine-generating enzyme required for sulfatase activity
MPEAATPTPFGLSQNSDWTPQIETFDGVDMVFVPAGCFVMGSDAGEVDEVPAHRLCVDTPFYLDRYEVSNGQFERIGGRAAHASRWPDENRPRDQITWFEANDFCALRRARLPTEVEWEYAARGPSSWAYPWGDQFLAEYTVFVGNANSQTADVGSKPWGASWVGAVDMSGNVREWVSTLSSVWMAYPYNPNDGRENMSDATERRVQRGGGFLNTSETVYAYSRDGVYPDYWSSDYGFRCARS